MDGKGIALCVGLLAIIVLICLCTGKKEGYGGPIKRIRRIPKTTCFELCKQNYDGCMQAMWQTNADGCMNRYTSCTNVCRYTDYHRL